MFKTTSKIINAAGHASLDDDLILLVVLLHCYWGLACTMMDLRVSVVELLDDLLYAVVLWVSFRTHHFCVVHKQRLGSLHVRLLV